MGKAEITIFIITISLVLFIFLFAAIVFIFQFRKRKLMHWQEKEKIQELHAQQLLTTQLEIQQQTMQYIGREIHDNVGQKLTLAALYTQQLGFKNEYPAINQQLIGIGNIIDESLSELRSLSKNLTNNYLQNTLLPDLLKIECDKVNALGNCIALFECSQPNMQIDTPIKTIIVRLLQEFIQNSLKHAACTVIKVQLQNNENGLLLNINDNGKGFDVLQKTPNTGIGISNMHKRAALIGANFSLKSELGNGTYLQLSLPPQSLIR